jgi:hypothetical protein
MAPRKKSSAASAAHLQQAAAHRLLRTADISALGCGASWPSSRAGLVNFLQSLSCDDLGWSDKVSSLLEELHLAARAAERYGPVWLSTEPQLEETASGYELRSVSEVVDELEEAGLVTRRKGGLYTAFAPARWPALEENMLVKSEEEEEEQEAELHAMALGMPPNPFEAMDALQEAAEMESAERQAQAILNEEAAHVEEGQQQEELWQGETAADYEGRLQEDEGAAEQDAAVQAAERAG